MTNGLNSQGYFAFNYMYTREFQNSEFFFKSTSEYYITRSDILQGQALFRGVKQLRKKMDKRQRDRQT